jgi:hypothetical protein
MERRSAPQDPRRGVVVEVGHGGRPLWKTLRDMPLPGQLYLGLDIDCDVWPRGGSITGATYRIDEGRRLIDQRRLERGSCHWMRIGDGGRLPLKAGSVDELYLIGVLSDPRISPLVLERLIEDAAFSVRPSGCLVIDNISAGLLSGPGDVLIDFDSGSALFRTGSGPLKEEERGSRCSLLLNAAFRPMPRAEHLGFLAARGLREHDDPEPGKRFSILTRR